MLQLVQVQGQALVAPRQHELVAVADHRLQNQNVFNVIGARISGVNDRAPNRMSIVRLYQGSIEDNKKAIHRVFNLNSEIDAPKALSFSIDWVYEAPAISKDEYDEKFAPLKQ